MSRPTLSDIEIVRWRKPEPTKHNDLDRNFHDYLDARDMTVTVTDGGLTTQIQYVPNIRFGFMFWHGERREVSNIFEDEKTLEITLKGTWSMLKDEEDDSPRLG